MGYQIIREITAPAMKTRFLIWILLVRVALAEHEIAPPDVRASETAKKGFSVSTLLGESFDADRISFEKEGISFLLDGLPKKIPFVDLESISSRNKSVNPQATDDGSVLVVLPGGGHIRVRNFRIQGSVLAGELTDTTPVKLKLSDIESVLLKPLTSEVKAQLDELRTTKKSGDCAFFEKNGKLDAVEGTVESISEAKINFVLDGEKMSIKREKITGIDFFQKPTNKKHSDGLVTDDRGNQFASHQLTQEGDTLVIETPTGAQFKRPLSSIRQIDFGTANSDKLTSLTPESITVHPYVDLGQKPDPETHFRVGKSVYGPLSLGKEFDDGVSMRSHTLANYRLKEDYRIFRATIGMNDLVKGTGKAKFLIKGDGKTLFERDVDGKTPEHIEVNIKGVKRLTLEVQFGDGSDVGDVVDVVGARLFR